MQYLLLLEDELRSSVLHFVRTLLLLLNLVAAKQFKYYLDCSVTLSPGGLKLNII